MPRKLKLQMEELKVDTFITAASAETKGTVVGEQITSPGNLSCNGTCGQYTCYHSCDLWCTEGATCDANGYGTCGMRQC